MNIRWMIPRDYSEVLAIDEAGYPLSMTREILAKLLRERNVIGVVVEDGEAVVGYAVYRLGVKTLSVLGLAVHPDHRRRGVGSMLVRRLQASCRPDGRKWLRVVCDLAQLAGCCLLKRHGFYGALQRDGVSVAFHWSVIAREREEVA